MLPHLRFKGEMLDLIVLTPVHGLFVLLFLIRSEIFLCFRLKIRQKNEEPICESASFSLLVLGWDVRLGISYWSFPVV